MANSGSRRHLLCGLGAAALTVATGTPPAPARADEARPVRPHEPFTFLFITDTHLQPELQAAAGCRQSFLKARTIASDFVIQGGDHIFDALGTGYGRADSLLKLYDGTEQDLGMQVHHTIGNHDCLGVYAKSGVAPTDPLYGKKFFEDHFGQRYYSFDHRGVHFVVLDSIGITPERDYEGRVDPAQMTWLRADLGAQPAGTPIVVVSHIPLVTAFACYDPQAAAKPTPNRYSGLNAAEVIAALAGHNILGVLQGHTHINETVWWRGVPFITGGAVSGNWWHGTHLGTEEGFTVVEVSGNSLATRYETYGFKSVDPHNT